MKKKFAEIISSGTEIMQGLYPDTNACHLSARLEKLGYAVKYHTAVGDDLNALCEVLEIAHKRANVVIITGGLGPTVDDLTRQSVAAVYGRSLVSDKHAEEMIRSFFYSLWMKMPENNLAQAQLPAGCLPLYNSRGTAPGFIIHEPEAEKVLIALPGPPRECLPMFDEQAVEFLKTNFSSACAMETLVLRTINVSESRLNEQLQPLFGAIPNVSIGFLAKAGKIDIRVIASASTPLETRDLLENAKTQILRRISPDCVYAEGENVTIEQCVANRLAALNLTVAAAESCTGGLVAKRLTDIPGSSRYFIEGAVAYSNETKIKRLGVREKTLNQYGAVSGETAAEMAAGMRKISSADIAISITGIAGPSGGSETKPVGLVYFGLAAKDYVLSCQRRFKGERDLIRERAADFALVLIRRCI
ncbi:MAG TPA: competence/damage-inducible protein A [Candidatus Sumerlaeota bacterium]|nr:competence/damage-inducible protein A [Candidatus Sumerlaeota bacterium]HRR98751.1 competence/damage-inducible protein A [Candidatus Sumerlaeia bacterium]HON50302.1 competence/damage-inducible protein A [Candidatus Sumerlaeota bacterium]HOR63518.1 competence/damage-inducible protein A [Candidatus Sumerlaeota bacterium]HPL73484.1 competence/damage-inducible protein A [Candidatus Sumerlaeota bacterium]